MPNRSCFILQLMAAIAACGDDTSTIGDISVQIEDSAGVRIVAYEETPTAEPSFRLAAEPRYRHGANPGDYAFQEAGTGRLLPDGSAVVYDAWNAELVVFGRDGATFDVVATEGEGPGDVEHVSAIFALGRDSILVADTNLGRVTLFVGGEVARTTDIRHTSGLGVEGIGASGKLLLATSRSPFRFENKWFPGQMARLDMATGAVDTVASYDFSRRIPPELEWDPIAPVGRVTVAAGHFVYTRFDRAEVTWHLPDGTVKQIVRWQAEPALLTEEWLVPIEAEHRMSVRMHSPGVTEDRIAEITRSNTAAYEASLGRPLPRFGSPFAEAGERFGRASDHGDALLDVRFADIGRNLPQFEVQRTLGGQLAIETVAAYGHVVGPVDCPINNNHTTPVGQSRIQRRYGHWLVSESAGDPFDSHAGIRENGGYGVEPGSALGPDRDSHRRPLTLGDFRSWPDNQLPAVRQRHLGCVSRSYLRSSGVRHCPDVGATGIEE